MTPLVLKMMRSLGLSPIPYVVAVATASNIGSTATITGNPQNMLIGSLSGIPYVVFLGHLGPVAVMGLLLNWGLLHRIYRRGPLDHVPVAQALSSAGLGRAPMRSKPVVVLVIVLAGCLAGVPPSLMAAIGAAIC
jgi:Na+/H+ antiporter NhaD/arsenite permease-like protein